MPTYEYICENCEHEFETFQLMKADPLKDCPECENSSLRRKIGLGAGIIFKGGGFYETDFKDKKGKADSSSDSTKSDSGKTESADTKSETKTESKPAASTESKSKSSEA